MFTVRLLGKNKLRVSRERERKREREREKEGGRGRQKYKVDGGWMKERGHPKICKCDIFPVCSISTRGPRRPPPALHKHRHVTAILQIFLYKLHTHTNPATTTVRVYTHCSTLKEVLMQRRGTQIDLHHRKVVNGHGKKIQSRPCWPYHTM